MADALGAVAVAKPVVKSIGVHLAAGRRRTMQGLLKRLGDFSKRLRRFRQLRRSGVCTARLMRTGGVAALTYGVNVSGVAPTLLRRQRRAVAAAAAPGHGICGQSLDLARILADGSATGKADPAFAAHIGPIGFWATAVYEQWAPLDDLAGLVLSSTQRLCAARNPWAVVKRGRQLRLLQPPHDSTGRWKTPASSSPTWVASST